MKQLSKLFILLLVLFYLFLFPRTLPTLKDFFLSPWNALNSPPHSMNGSEPLIHFENLAKIYAIPSFQVSEAIQKHVIVHINWVYSALPLAEVDSSHWLFYYPTESLTTNCRLKGEEGGVNLAYCD